MKFKTTAKAIRNEGGHIIKIGYCDAQHLLHYHDPIAYTSGVYGWNFDVYEIMGTTICTGYRGMVGRPVNYERLREYEKKAQEIVYDWSLDYSDAHNAVERLLDEFIRAEFADWIKEMREK